MSRYDRHIKLAAFGGQVGQEKLSQAKVLVVGVGGLGCAALPYLVSSGIGQIGLMDADVVDLSNLQRQILFDEADVGHFKVDCAKNRLSALNTTVQFTTYSHDLTPENAEEIIGRYDLVLDCTDRFEARYLINDACVRKNKPWVFGALHQFEGQVSVFNFRGGPTYRCLFPFDRDQQQLPSCADVGVFAPAVGVVGVMQASEALKVLLDLDDALSGKLLCMDLKTNATQRINFQRNQSAVNQILEKPEINLVAPEEDSALDNGAYVFDLDAEKALENYLWIDLREPHEFPEINHKLVESIPLSQFDPQTSFWKEKGPCVLFCASGYRARTLAEKLKLPNVQYVTLSPNQIQLLLNQKTI
jgi:molybdopterin/thiamine biosynthesis adenylyltransferase